MANIINEVTGLFAGARKKSDGGRPAEDGSFTKFYDADGREVRTLADDEKVLVETGSSLSPSDRPVYGITTA